MSASGLVLLLRFCVYGGVSSSSCDDESPLAKKQKQLEEQNMNYSVKITDLMFWCVFFQLLFYI
jgi:hypothetical protein